MASERSDPHPKRWKWRLEWLAHTCLEKLLGYLPAPLVFRIGESLGSLAWHFLPQRRRIVLRNLRIAFHGEYDLPTLQRMARETIRRTGANLFSAAHTARLRGDQIDAMLTIENQPLIEQAMSSNAGLVLMPPHMGNWEILSRMNRLFPQGYGIGAFYRPLNNPLLNERLEAQRKIDGTRLFAKRDSLHLVTGFLRDGGLIGILADQRVGQQGELVRFFGRLTRASPLPSLLARRAKSEVLTLSLITEAPGKWKVRYHSVERPYKTPECVEAIESAMRASPLDVFWLQERWKVFISRKRSIREWLGPEICGEGKPHRALLWLADAPATWSLPAEWTHTDVIYEAVLNRDQTRPAWLPEDSILHYISAGALQKALQKSIATIDLAAALPVDYILACGASHAVINAAQREAIPIVSLSPIPEIS